MRVRYRFPVSGRLRLEFSHPVRTQLFTYTCEVSEDGVVTYLNATALANDRSTWPIIVKNPQPGIEAHIQMNTPYFPLLRRDMRAVAGILALYGVDEVAVDEAEEIWEPESEEEKSSLAIYSMKRTTEKTQPATWPRVPFDLVARALMTAERVGDFEAALNFFRKGKIDIQAKQYIDAVLDFLFVLETTYANGKFKTAQVEQEYLSSDELHRLVCEAQRDRVLHQNVKGHIQIETDFKRVYATQPSEEIIKYLVRLRGELHHHTSRKNGIWHPADHVRFGSDAYFLQQLCFGICFTIATPTLFDDVLTHEYQAQAHAYAKAGSLKVHTK